MALVIINIHVKQFLFFVFSMLINRRELFNSLMVCMSTYVFQRTATTPVNWEIALSFLWWE